MRRFIFAFVVLVSFSSFASWNCQKMNNSISSTEPLYSFIDRLAQIYVYYGNLSTVKVDSVQDVRRVQFCKDSNSVRSAQLIRFKVWAKDKKMPEAKKQLYYCYSKQKRLSGDWLNNGTFCEEAKRSLASSDDTLTMPEGQDWQYNSGADPYGAQYGGIPSRGPDDSSDPDFPSRDDDDDNNNSGPIFGSDDGGYN